jgi:hypothetical protein
VKPDPDLSSTRSWLLYALERVAAGDDVALGLIGNPLLLGAQLESRGPCGFCKAALKNGSTHYFSEIFLRPWVTNV